MLSSLSSAWSDNVLIPFSLMFLQVLQEMDYFSMVDYFSLGVIVYEMAFGKHPFITSTDDWEQIKMKMIYMEPDFEEGMDPDLHNLLVRVSYREPQLLYCSDIVIGHAASLYISFSYISFFITASVERPRGPKPSSQ